MTLSVALMKEAVVVTTSKQLEQPDLFQLLPDDHTGLSHLLERPHAVGFQTEPKAT
jgi:hypothetical protein